MSPLAAQALQVAASQIGVMEQPEGSNRGLMVDQYIRNAGLNPVNHAYSWCECFVYWCFTLAAENLIMPNPLKRTAVVLDQWNSNPLRQIAVKNAQPGDIGTIRHRDLKTGHTFLIESIDAAGVWKTIEGNTNTDGSSNGIGVFSLERDPAKNLLIIGALRF